MTARTVDATDFDQLRAQVQAEVLARLPDCIERMRCSREQVEASQREGLRALLANAIENSPFHHSRLGDVDPSRFDLPDLKGLPVMSKTEMMESLDDVFTDRRLNRRLVEQALAVTATQPVPILGRYTALASGGVSGQRGVFVYDPGAVAGYTSSLTRSLMARLRTLGDAAREGLTIGLVAAASAVHGTRSTVAWLAGDASPIRATPIPVTLPLPEIVERLNALQPRFLYGYASILVRLAAEQRAGRLQIRPMSVTSTSETLVDEARAAIAEAFAAPIVDIFGSSEGLVGTSAPDDDVLIFNSDFCIVELVDAENQPVPPGVPSAKVLLTNVYIHTQPLIRYELTDSFGKRPDRPSPGTDTGHGKAQALPTLP